MKHIKCVVVGDGRVGKTCLLLSYCTNAFPGEYVPTVFDNFSAAPVCEGHHINLQLWDTAGQDDYKKLRPLSYPQTNVFILCFSLVSPTSLTRLQDFGVREIQEHSVTTPYIVVGLQADLRDQVAANPEEWKAKGMVAVTRAQGQAMQRAIHARAYVECSAKMQVNLTEVFDAAIRVVLFPPDGVRPEPPTGLDILRAAQTLSLEDFVRAFPEIWMKQRPTIERLMMSAAVANAQVWDGDLHAKNVWIWGAPAIGKSRFAAQQSPVRSTLRKNCDAIWDGYSLAMTDHVIVENFPAAPEGDQLVSELEKWGDRYPFVGTVRRSTMLVEPARFTLVVTSHYSIAECFSRPVEQEAMRARFLEVEMTADNRDDVLQRKLDRSILRR
jgi:Ras-related C3 botulinum toxin substrate 1